MRRNHWNPARTEWHGLVTGVPLSHTSAAKHPATEPTGVRAEAVSPVLGTLNGTQSVRLMAEYLCRASAQSSGRACASLVERRMSESSACA
eukprot:2632407-Rhodomonas_salina.1